MASIKDLKKRITSTKNTQQTTKAMKMVSAAKLRRATDAILSQRPYALEISKLMERLSGQGAGISDDVANRAAVTLLVVISADRGLCAGYNANITRAAGNFLTEKAAEGKKVKTLFIGKKTYELLKNRFTLDLVHYEEFGPKITFRKAESLSKKMMAVYDKGEVNEIVFIYNHFVNAMSQEVMTDRVLPLGSNEASGSDTEAHVLRSELAIYSPSKNELFEALSGKYFVVQIFKSLLEAQASEHGARMSAMENATKNAGDMIRKLTLQYNKQRQASITKELLEIIAGSESQKV